MLLNVSVKKRIHRFFDLDKKRFCQSHCICHRYSPQKGRFIRTRKVDIFLGKVDPSYGFW